MSTKSLYWWLRLTVAAFVLSAWVAVGLTSGIARADDPSPSKGDSTSESSADAPKGPKAPKPPKAPKADAPTTSDSETEASPDASAPTVEETTSGSKKPTTRRSTHRPKLTVASVKPVKPAKEDPQSSTTEASTTSTPDSQPVAAKIAAVAPTASSTPSANTIRAPKPREVVGLVSDVGVVAVSVVYTAANTVADIFGPHTFFGAPYALASAVANSAAAVGRTLIGAPPGSASTGPFRVTYGVLEGLSFLTPQKPPPGANDPDITVTPEHPLPIILINGTIATQGENWGVGAPVLANAGYKVYTFNYGNVTSNPNAPIQATDDIRESAKQLAAEVNKVLEETGAPKVILIGHSQGGGILPAYYINNLDGASKVSQVIGIAPSNHGTDASGLIGLQGLPILGPLVVAFANALGPALEQQSVGNAFQQEVYGNGDTRPGVLYTNIISKNDEVVTPYTQQLLEGDGVTNIVLQDLYPGLPAGHLGVVLSPQVWDLVLDALASNAAANPMLESDELVA